MVEEEREREGKTIPDGSRFLRGADGERRFEVRKGRKEGGGEAIDRQSGDKVK